MCGIAGFFSTSPIPSLMPEAMLKGIRNRGPDAEGIQCWKKKIDNNTIDASFIHSRLAIRDLSDNAQQPMANKDEQVWICYNGEIYDWENDAEHLKKQGFLFQSQSDTEYILNAYIAYGFDEMLKRLRGMFAFAIIDFRTQQLHLARDRFGLKPLLYYHNPNGSFAFGSTVRTLLPFLPDQQRSFSGKAIDAYLAHRYIPAPLTIFEHIHRLENAHCLSLDLASFKLKHKAYWQPKKSHTHWDKSLDKAIELRTVSDRPLGLFLSGGIDSSTLAARLAALGYNNITCYSAAFPGSSFDESRQAEAFAKKLGMAHKKVIIPKTIKQDFHTIIADLDEPFADPSSFPTWYLAQQTVQTATVVLGGDGGDELLAGYKRYQKHLRSTKRWVLPKWGNHFASWHPKGWRKIAIESSLSWEDAYSLRFSGFHPAQRHFLQPDYPCKIHYWRLPTNSHTPLTQLLEIDRLNYLPEYILRKSDLCTMAHGLEQRVPLLDHYFYQSLLTLSPTERFTQPTKQLLSKAAPEIIPLLTQKKRGFNPPLENWLKHDLISQQDKLGERLQVLTNQQINADSCNLFIKKYYSGCSALAEQVLQLYILDESLQQLNQLRKNSLY